MLLEATRLNDFNTGHDSCAPRPLVVGSPNVYINGRPSGRVGDSYAVHSCIAHPPHAGVIAKGSENVRINGKFAGRVTDPVSCGGNVAQGSENVRIGG